MSNRPGYNHDDDDSKIEANVVSDILVKSECADLSYNVKTELQECSCYSEDTKSDPTLVCAGCGVSVKSEVDSCYTVKHQDVKLEIKAEEEQSDCTVYQSPVVNSLNSTLNLSDIAVEDQPPSVTPAFEHQTEVVPDDSLESQAGLQNHLQLLLATQKRISWMTSQTLSPLKRRSASQGVECLHKRKKTHMHKYIFNCNMNLCSYKTYLKLRFRYHINTKHAGEKPWKCNKCHFATAKRNSLDMHNKCHASNHRYLCKFCDYSSLSLIQLDAHIKGHPSGHLFYKCPECDFTSCIANNLYHHLGVAHSDGNSSEKPWKCDRCPLAFAYGTTLNAHAKCHDQEEVCDKESEKAEKELHREHKMNFFDCELCDYTTRKKLNLRHHINIKHAKEKPWKCTKCHFATGSLNNLIFHEQCHGSDNRYTCHFCDYSTHSLVQLDAHIKGHPDARSLKCLECDFTSYVADNLKEHFNKTHPDYQFKKPVMKWKCIKCDLAFASRTSLNAHVKCHDQEEALYICSICQFTASTTKLFDLHMREHSEQTHECPKCDFKSYFLDLFNEHLQTHLQTQLNKAQSSVQQSNEKLWKCDKCEYSSDFESLLKMHRQIHITEQLCSELQ